MGTGAPTGAPTGAAPTLHGAVPFPKQRWVQSQPGLQMPPIARLTGGVLIFPCRALGERAPTNPHPGAPRPLHGGELTPRPTRRGSARAQNFRPRPAAPPRAQPRAPTRLAAVAVRGSRGRPSVQPIAGPRRVRTALAGRGPRGARRPGPRPAARRRVALRRELADALPGAGVGRPHAACGGGSDGWRPITAPGAAASGRSRAPPPDLGSPCVLAPGRPRPLHARNPPRTSRGSDSGPAAPPPAPSGQPGPPLAPPLTQAPPPGSRRSRSTGGAQAARCTPDP